MDLEYHVLIFLFPQDVGSSWIVDVLLIASAPLGSLLFLFCGIIVSLLIALNLLQAVEFLSVKFIQLRIYILDGVLGAWYNDVFDRIDSPVHNLDDLVKGDESCLSQMLKGSGQDCKVSTLMTNLQTSKLHQSFHGSCIRFSAPLNLLSSFP